MHHIVIITIEIFLNKNNSNNNNNNNNDDDKTLLAHVFYNAEMVSTKPFKFN